MSAKSEKSSRKAVLVLGMHRSGTSALAGTLSILGCDLPATPMKADPNNPKGYFESSKFHVLHDQLLHSAGSSWDDWLPVNQGWFESARAEEYRDRIATALREEFGDSRLFVMKDPRICRLLPLWFDVLDHEGCAPLVVHTHRHPLEVARSLERRDGIGLDLGMLLWIRHILDAERDSRGRPRYFTSYERVMTSWAEMAEGLQEALDVKLPRMTRKVAGEVEEFLAPDLKHFSDSPDKVLRSPMISEWIRDIYRIVESWAESGENEDDLPTLDRIREEFDTAAPAFHRLVEVGQQTSRALKDKIAELSRLSDEKSDLQAQLSDSGSTVKELRQQLSDAQSETTRHQQDIARLNEEKSGLESELSDSGNTVEELRQKLAEALTESETRAAKLVELQQDFEQRNTLVDTLTRKLDSAVAEHTAESDRSNRLEAELEQAKAELAALKHELAQTRSHLEQRTHEAEQTAQQLAEAKSEVADKTRQIETLRAEIGRQQHELASRDEMARQHASDMANISTLLSERESSLNASQQEIARLEGSLKSVTDQLNEERLSHAAAVARDAEQVRELEHSVESQVRELTQIAQLLLDTETKLEQAQAKSSQDSEQMRKLQAELEEVRTTSKVAEKETADLKDKLKKMTDKSKKAEARVADLESSRSWRITAPLRSISRVLTGRR